jgi:hypothetical protein
MHALVCRSPGAGARDDVRGPVLQDDTAPVVGIDASATCGTDLRIQPDDVPAVCAVAEPSRAPDGPRVRRAGTGAS